jgi:hypothetical protein
MAYSAPFSLWRASQALRCALCSLFLASNLAAAAVEPGSTGTLIGPRLSAGDAGAAAIFEPAYDETTVTARLGQNRCFVVRLPGKWGLVEGADGVSLREAASEGQVDLALHEAASFASAPGSNLLASYAAHLQRDYEELLGRPAIAATLESTELSGAYRWRATWADNNFENAARALNLERFIIQPWSNAVIEFSVSGIDPGEELDHIARSALSTLELREKSNCRP